MEATPSPACARRADRSLFRSGGTPLLLMTTRKEAQIESLELALKAREMIEKKQGKDIVLFDVRKISTLTDYYLVTSGSSPPHLKAMFNDLQIALKKQGVHYYRKAGVPESGWLLLDYIDVIIHIFSIEIRQYYAIEDLWAEAPLVERATPRRRARRGPATP